MFDLASIQFALHYAFENEEMLRCLLKNVSTHLRTGGHFLGTLPNANWIVYFYLIIRKDLICSKKLRSQPGNLSFGNDVYNVTFEQAETFPTFGHKYTFRLVDAIDDMPEYLVHFPTLVRIAKEYDLELVECTPFHEFVYELLNPSGVLDRDNSRKVQISNADREVAFTLAHSMRVCDAQGNFPQNMWDACSELKFT